MYWLRRPPYLRWLAAGTLIAVALIAEFRPSPTVPYPFAAAAVEAGRVPDEVEYRRVPAGLLPAVAALGPAAGPISAGAPLVPDLFADDPGIPEGWWAVPVPLDAAAVAGAEVRIVLLRPRATVSGIVVAPGRDDGFTTRPIGLVAVAEPDVDAVVTAVAGNDAVVVTRP